jgi:threonine aldolase
MEGIAVRPVQTNIVIFDLPTGCHPRATAAALKERGVLINAVNDEFMRAVTHYDVNREDCIEAMDALEEAIRELMPS